MTKVVSLPSPTRPIQSHLTLRTYKVGLNDIVNVFRHGESGITRLASMEITPEGHIITLRFSTPGRAPWEVSEENVNVPRVPL